MKVVAASAAGLAALVLAIPLLLVPTPTPDAAARGVPARYAELVEAAASTCPGLPAPLLAAQLQRESGWNPAAVSPAGAQGLGQFLPATWTAYGVDADRDGTADPFNPADAISGAARYDCHLLTLVRGLPGDPLALMLAAYNAGPSAVLQHRGVPPYPETVEYVRAVFAALPRFSQQTPRGAAGLTPRAALVRQEVIAVFGVHDIGGYAQSGHVEGSDHYTGRAIDIMLLPLGDAQTARGWRIAIHLQSNAARLGITYLIWQGRIWSPQRAAAGWRPYSHPTGGSSPTLLHMDHVHVSVR